MSDICEVCGKKPAFGNNVSHSHKKTKRVFKPNIIKTKAEVDGTVRIIKVCSKCLKAGKIKKAV